MRKVFEEAGVKPPKTIKLFPSKSKTVNIILVLIFTMCYITLISYVEL